MINFISKSVYRIAVLCLLTCAFSVPAAAQEERIEEILYWLHANSITTYRTADYNLLLRTMDDVGLKDVDYFFNPIFTDEGIVSSNKFGQLELAKWERIYMIGITKTKRIVYNWEPEIDHDKAVSERTQYLTPSSTTNIDEYLNKLKLILEISGNQSFNVVRDVNDLDEVHRLKKEQEEAAVFARAQEMDDLMSLFGSAWEFEGTMTGGIGETASESSGGHYAQLKITHFTSKLKFIYGTKRVRLMMAPVSFSWTTLPSYTRLDDKGDMINRDNLGAITSYSPEIGLQFVYFPSKEMDNPDREWEILLNVGYAALFPFKAKDLEESGSELSDYLPSYNDLLSSSLELNLFPSPSFGYGFIGGIRKLRMPTTTGQLSGTYFDKDVSFTAKFDDLKTLLPYFGAKLMFRFQ